MTRRLHSNTTQTIARLFDRLDYKTLAGVYCDAGGLAFWKARKHPCQKLGIRLAEALRERLQPGGKSLYVGAGVAELPMLVMETLELGRTVAALNLRAEEVTVLNEAGQGLPFRFIHGNASTAEGTFDHLWVVSVLNDPERFPNLSELSYGRANPATFNTASFVRERKEVVALTDACLRKLSCPGLVTTSVEEIPWITGWCEQHRRAYVVESKTYPTAIVEDPVCVIQIEKPGKMRR